MAEKLIRGKMQPIIEEGDKNKPPEKRVKFRIATPVEKPSALARKLVEEALEFEEAILAGNHSGSKKELADVMQAVTDILRLKGFDLLEINHLVHQKLHERGDFSDGLMADFPEDWEMPKKE